MKTQTKVKHSVLSLGDYIKTNDLNPISGLIIGFNKGLISILDRNENVLLRPRWTIKKIC